MPKPFTPFQFAPQITEDEIRRRQEYLKNSITTRKISLSYHDSKTSFLEGVLARGDRRLGAVLETAVKNGCRFDSWTECFNLENWLDAFKNCGIDPAFYANRQREYDEITPWEHLDYESRQDGDV